MACTKTMMVGLGIALIGVVNVAAFAPQNTPGMHYSNLKVLPKNISPQELSKIMAGEFQDDLGVSCYFCHSENKQTHQPDFASDDKPEKRIARAMMLMTMGINKKYFKVKHAMVGDPRLAITCATCHHGQAFPE
jgi:hypothetical protein